MSATGVLSGAIDHHQPGLSTAFENQYVSFRLGDQLLGVPVRCVQEVLHFQNIARTPRAREEVAGLLNLRGQIVTALNLRKRLGLPPLEDGRQSMNVVLHHKGEPFSLLVDEVGDVIDVSDETMEGVPPTLEAHWKRVTKGVFRLKDELLIVLDVAAVLQL